MPSTDSCRVTRQIKGCSASDGDGVRINRLIGGPELSETDPFLLFDEFVSDNPDDYIGGFPQHPHRGFETVTYMLAGKMRHKDNQGNEGVLCAGSVQWMTAGRGILHSEMPEQENGLMWGFQLWVNLPSKSKMIQPRYQDIAADQIPVFDNSDGVSISVIAGACGGLKGPVRNIDADPLYLDVRMGEKSSADIDIQSTHNGFVYCYSGQLKIGQTSVTKGNLALLNAGTTLSMTTGRQSASAIVLAGLPFGEPIVRYGPFVMNTHEEINQAIYDVQNNLI